LDIDEDSLNWLRDKMPDDEFFCGDAERLQNNQGADGSFDLIIAGDVIEHLANPGMFLDSCRPLLKRNGRLLITTINSFGIGLFAKALLNHEAVHPEHTAYFSQKTLDRLCSMCGYKVLKRGYIKGATRPGFSLGALNIFCTNLLEQVATVIYPQFSSGILVEAESGLQSKND
jgi:ubiquinone/menaquinone biosynthesis C-methylase UbiE